ncbi:MAG: hypothetical protein U9Q81_21005, partial [Pseudomonadota bacterium]|nr:hypothetical protein [Pseudomonadota bacterium]
MAVHIQTIVVVAALLISPINVLARANLGPISPNKGLTGGTVLEVVPKPVFPPPDDAPPEDVPNAPPFHVERKTTRSFLLKFLDRSDIEAGFRLYRQPSGGDWKEIGSFGPIDDPGEPYFIMDDDEQGFILRKDADGDEDDIPVNPPSRWTMNRTKEIMPDTSYCYRLAPFNDAGTEPDNVFESCATTPINLLSSTKQDELSTDRGSALHPATQDVSVDVTEFDEAVLVSDREGLLGELNANWKGPDGEKREKLIYVADDAKIDLSYLRNIPLKDKVTLASGRRNLNEGAFLYTRVANETALFQTIGSNIRVTGLRFRGPSGSKDPNQPSAAAIHINFGEFPELDDQDGNSMIDDGQINVLIDHNEFYHWPYTAIRVSGRMRAEKVEKVEYYCTADWSPFGPRWIDKNTARRIRITRNYFHDNQKKGLGYGIQVQSSAYAYIDKNTFDSHRHAVAADSRPETGYIARDNLVLSGGGRYCDKKLGVEYCWYEHHFDMHGACNPGHWDHGPAGEYVEIESNTIRGAQTYALHAKTRAAFDIRGTPSDSAYFRYNVVKHDNEGEAVRENSKRKNVHTYGNHFNVDTRSELGVGNFDGDGIDDVFQATGAAWYYSSGGKSEWRF